MAREINLVPDIKYEMIKALKLRNFIFFLCIAVAAGAIGAVAILGGIVGGQSIALSNRDETLKLASSKINSYDDLNDFLTIQNQLGKLSTISENKKVLSRTFDILSSLIPVGEDTITISELNIDLANNAWSFDAQANAGGDGIDYRVLNAFEKSMEYLRYDYGHYVDDKDNEIPAYCMIENNADGAIFNDPERGIYALWTKEVDGCDFVEEEDEEENEPTINANYESYNGQNVVKIWRTPQYDEWYNSDLMSEDGTISGVPHFNSECTSYYAEEDGAGKMQWKSENNECGLIDVSQGVNGITVADSSNGRDSSNELVLRFSAVIYFDENVYKFSNKHLIAVAPSGKHTVTDSYLQIQNMFSERAKDCAADDTACKNAKTGGK